eukprot:1237892-Pleurochrysis_carterae.AAC.1
MRLFRRGALRRALEAIKAKLRVAIGWDRDPAPARKVSHEEVGKVESMTVSHVGGARERRRHATSMEGETTAKSITASLRFLSISFTMYAVRMISPGAYTSACPIAFVVRSNAGPKST